MKTRIRLASMSLLATVMVVAACGPQAADAGEGGAEASSPATTRSSDSGRPSSAASTPGSASSAEGTDMRIRIRIGDADLTGTLLDIPATRDLLAQLPLTLTMTDHGSVEKTGELPQPLSTAGVPSGADPALGDIGYYAPGNDLVLYYGDQSYYDGIVRLGAMEGDVDVVRQQSGDISVVIERATD